MNPEKQPDEVQEILDGYDPQAIALALHLENITADDLTGGLALQIQAEANGDDYDGENYIDALDDAQRFYDRGNYKVLTDDEADDLRDEYLDQYIEDVIKPEIPEASRFYFDDELRKKDARQDGRGHSLSSYNGQEHEETRDGVDYFIYRD